MSVLRAFQDGDTHLGNMELVRKTGIPKATISRMTYTLFRLGYLSYAPDIEKYSVSPGVLDLAYSVYLAHSIHVRARPLMQDLAERAKATVGLSVRDGTSMVFLDYAIVPSASLTQHLAIGFRVPIYMSSMGWACLAAMAPAQRASTLNEVKHPMKPSEWSVHHRNINKALKQFEDNGFCISLGDINSMTNAVGVPFVEQRGGEIYALNIVGPKYEFSPTRMEEELGPALLKMTEQLRSGASPAPRSKTSPKYKKRASA